MRIHYHPAVCWLTREDTSDSYSESWDWILQAFRRSAERYQWRENSGGSKAADADVLVFLGVAALQNKLVGQYLPRLVSGESPVVSWIWPSWKDAGVRVELGRGRVGTIAPPLPADDTVMCQRFEDGVEYAFKFYRSETFKQRERWFRHILRQTARSDSPRPRLKLWQMDEDTPEPGERAKFVDQVADRLLLKAVREIVDSKEYELAKKEESGLSGAELQARSRARRNLKTATEIIVRAQWDRRAQEYRKILKRTPDGKRAAVLRHFREWFLEED